MHISLNWLKQYIDIQETPEELSGILTSLGLEVESMAYLGVPDEHLEGVVVGEVLECWKHPNADRLHLTKANAGNGQILQVVCGAPNVATGQKVLLALEGATLHPTQGEHFTIKKGKIRGETSEGMICAEDELGLGKSHDGIMVLDPSSVVGTPAAKAFPRESDVVFEIGLTPNRADATSHLGVAKDLLAWYRVHRSGDKKLQEIPKIGLNQTGGNLNIRVQVIDSTMCPRYSGICLSGITVKESPVWLQNRIRSMGLQPINNVVDVTNFVLYELGQPLHAFDYDAIAGHEIVVQTLPAGTAFIGLDGLERKLRGEDLMICDGNHQPLCMAGVFGGLNSGISEKTRNIFLESAHFNATRVRASSMGHNLRTQSARCFEKGSDPNLTVEALERAVYLLQEVANANIDSELTDLYPHKIEPAQVRMNVEQSIHLSGLELGHEAWKNVLFAMDMEVRDTQDGYLDVFVPTNKPDVHRPADVVEEVSRVYGLDSIPTPEKLQLSFPKHLKTVYPLKRELAQWLSANGLHEIMSLSMTRSTLCIQSGLWTADDLVYINNTSNVHLDVMKPAVCLGGLEAIQHNSNRQQQDLAFFEIARQYQKHPDGWAESEKLGIWLYGNLMGKHWGQEKDKPADFFQLKSFVEGLFAFKKLNNLEGQKLQNDALFEYGMAFLGGGKALGKFGKLKGTLGNLYDLKKEIWYAEVDLATMMDQLQGVHRHYQDFSKLPMIKRDLALVLDTKVQYVEIDRLTKSTCGNILREIQLFDVYENAEQLGPEKKSYAISLTFEQPDRQMTGEEMEGMIQRLIGFYETQLGAIIRR